MPLVYACICPHPPAIVPEVGHGRESELDRTTQALRRVAAELAVFRPETVLVVGSHGPARRQAMGVLTAPAVEGDFARWGAPEVRFSFETDRELAERVLAEAERDEVPAAPLRRWDDGLDWGCTVPLYFLREALAGARLLPATVSWLGTPYHFAFGRAIGRAVADCGRRVAFVCSADLSHALTPEAPAGYDPAGRSFDERYRRAVEDWDVKWLVHVDREFRTHAAEDAVPQTAVLMGALSRSRIQPRVLSYEGPFGVGYLVAAIDVLGERGGPRAKAKESRVRAES